MSDVTSVHEVLDKANWTYEQIQFLLKRDPSTVNEILGGKAPLHRVLEDSKRPTNIIKLLINYGANANLLDDNEISPLTMALSCKNRVDIVRTLVEGGARVDPNTQYPMCTLSIALAMDAELEIIKLLLKAGADFNKSVINGMSPLFSVLGYRNSDMEGLKSILDSQDVNLKVRNQWNGTLLHQAMCPSSDCPLSFIKFLIDRGLPVDSVDDFGHTPLHEAVCRHPCKPAAVKLLLDRGSDTNKVNNYGETPLDLAIAAGHGSGVLMLLLKSGARLSSFSLKTALNNYDSDQCMEKFKVFLLLVKYSYLQCSNFDIHDVIRGHVLHVTFSSFANDCKRELKRMELDDIVGGHVLLDFVHAYAGTRMSAAAVCKESCYDIYLLLKVLADNTYPLYTEFISAKLHRPLLKTKLDECSVYTCTVDPESRCVLEKVVLYNDVLHFLAHFLSDSDLLNLILAFHI